MGKIVKNSFGNFLVILIIFLMVAGWMFSGWPQIWQRPLISPEIKIAKASPDQETLRPNADGHTTAWTISDTTHYGATNDQSDSTYIWEDTDDVYEFLNVQDPTFADGTTVNWIQTYYRCQCSGTCDKGPEKIDLYISDGTTDTKTDTVAVNRTGFDDIAGTQQTVNPVDSQAWEYQDIVDLQIGMMTNTTGGDQIQCSELWVVVDYTAAAPTVSCSTNISSTDFGILSSSSVTTSSPNASTTMSCSDTTLGCTLYVKDAGNGSNPGLATSSPAYLIPSPNAAFSASTTLSEGIEGYGIQATSTTPGLTLAERYALTDNDVGGLALSNQIVASSTADITDAEVIVTHKAAISETTFNGNYEDTITYECTINE